MSSTARYVFHTNTLVSAVLFEHSTPGQALRRALKRGEVLISPSTLEELAEVLQREKFDRYVTAAEREEFLFEEPIGQLLLANRRVRLLIFDLQTEVIRQWIP